MKIKKFQARTFAEALAMVKKELSEDAIILSTEQMKGSNPFVEVTAAVDYDVNKSAVQRPLVTKKPLRQEPLLKPRSLVSEKDPTVSAPKEKPIEKVLQRVQSKINITASDKIGYKEIYDEIYEERTDAPESKQPQDKTIKDKQPAEAAPDVKFLIKRLTEDIKCEIEQLRDTIEDMKNTGYEMTLPPKKRMIFYFLKERSIREEYAILLCERAKELEDIPSLLISNIKIKKPDSDMKAVMLIGPTGVGKTTTVAKLAARAVKEGKRAAIINLDTFRIGAVEQVRIYSRILGIPLAVVTTPKELKSTLMRFSETRDVIFIDTTGRSPKDEDYIANLSEICRCEVPMEVHLLMSANSDDEFLTESYRYYRRIPVNYLGFTKVDEAVRFGSLYNLMLTYQKPMAYITTGQKVPDDIELANMEGLANLILKKEYYKC